MWDDVKGLISKAAPVVGLALGGPAGAGIGGMISSVLGVENNAASVFEALQDPAALLKIKQLETSHKEKILAMHLAAETKQISEVNATMRAEAAASDPYVRRWRPTWGYVTAGSWAMQSLAIFCVCMAAIFSDDAAKASALFNGAATLAGALTAQWSVALAVLGVNVYKRSDDKAVAAGKQPTGLLGIFSNKK